MWLKLLWRFSVVFLKCRHPISFPKLNHVISVIIGINNLKNVDIFLKSQTLMPLIPSLHQVSWSSTCLFFSANLLLCRWTNSNRFHLLNEGNNNSCIAQLLSFLSVIGAKTGGIARLISVMYCFCSAATQRLSIFQAKGHICSHSLSLSIKVKHVWIMLCFLYDFIRPAVHVVKRSNFHLPECKSFFFLFQPDVFCNNVVPVLF